MDLGKLVKAALPAVAGAFIGPAAGSLFPGATGIMANPFVQRALASGATGLLTGQKPKDAVISGIMGGLGGQFLDGRQAAMQQGLGGASNLTAFGGAKGDSVTEKIIKDKMAESAGAGFGAFKGSAPLAESKTLSGDLLQSLELAGEDKGNLLFKVMNSQLGEGLAAGLIAQLLAGDEEDAPQGEFERRPFGAGGPGGQLGGINYKDGGEAYFPRRNGGIDPTEGSGKKDDVPAMLMAGEFVMTRDAVKGMGDGNLRKGINRMYGMMDNLERMA